MQASDFEFRYRFFVIGAVFWAGFSLYSFDHVNATVTFSKWIAAHTALPVPPVIRAIFCLAALLCVLAALIRTWASAYLSSDVVHDTSLHAERLVADGPYRHVRNPLYLGLILLGIGMGAMASRAGFFVIVIGLTLVSYRLIAREEVGILGTSLRQEWTGYK